MGKVCRQVGLGRVMPSRNAAANVLKMFFSICSLEFVPLEAPVDGSRVSRSGYGGTVLLRGITSRTN